MLNRLVVFVKIVENVPVVRPVQHSTRLPDRVHPQQPAPYVYRFYARASRQHRPDR